MNKYKVCVYAIAKNEEKNVQKWVESMSEADEIYVMIDDTSSDKTEELLNQAGVHTTRKLIRPWRFDTARNESLKLVPNDADICVCTDLDEIFSPGWRKILEEKWQPDTNQAYYKFWHNANSKDQTPNIFDYCKIHDRHNFSWNWIIHEYILPIKKDMQVKTVYLDGVMLYHYPDCSKPRSYAKLLETAIKEEPDVERYKVLLLEEYVSANDYSSANKLIKKIFQDKNMMSQPYYKCWTYMLACKNEKNQNNLEKAKRYCEELVLDITNCKWFYGELGDLLLNHFKEYELSIGNLLKCLSINNDVVPSREADWNDKAKIHNLLSIAYYYIRDYDKAIEHICEAIKLTNNQNTLKTYRGNKKIYQDVKKAKQKLINYS